MSQDIPVFVPQIGIDTLKAVTDAFDVGWLGMGAATQEFERKLRAFIGRPTVVTNTGTSALHLGLLLAGVGAGDEVIVPAFNYVADHQAITATGAVPVFCDVCEDDLGLDPDKAAKLISPRTKAIMPLHYAGIPCRLDEIYELARRHRLRVIEDATHAFGSRYRGRRIGSFGDIACFSFDPVKVITSIDGGAVVVNDETDVETLHHLRFLGVDKDTIERYKNKRAWEYDVVRQGYRYHMTNINASIGLSQLRRVDEFILSRRRACRRYNAGLTDIPGLCIPATEFHHVSPFIYFVRVMGGRRNEFTEYLRDGGIATGVHFLAAHRFSFYKSAPRGDLSVTEKVSEEIVTLPLHSNMRPDLVDRIVARIRQFFDAGDPCPPLTLRKARRDAAECDLLLAWRIDPDARRMFYRSDFGRKDYERTYFEPDSPPSVWVEDRQQRRVAMLRFRRYSQFRPPLPEPLAARRAFDISVIVAPEFRGRGLAGACIELASEHALSWGAELLVAEIKLDNKRSQRAFERAGYVYLDEVEKNIEGIAPFRIIRLIYPS